MSFKDVYIGVETTGTSPERHGIHQISGEIWKDGSMLTDFDLRFRPPHGCQIEDEALSTGQLTVSDVMSRHMGAMTAHQNLVHTLTQFVDKYDRGDKFRFIGYNAGFDWNMMQAFFRWAGDAYFGSLFWFPVIDVAQEAFKCMDEKVRASLINFKLGTVATHFGIEATGSLHDAMVDINLTRRLHKHLLSTNQRGSHNDQ